MNEKLTYRILLMGSIVWCFAILLPPLCTVMGFANSSLLAKMFFAPVCNQLESHSIHIFGIPLAVCARCTAIYFSFLAGVIWRKSPRNRGVQKPQVSLYSFPRVFIFLSPMIVDVSVNLIFPTVPYALERRALTGILFGFPFAMALTPILINAAVELLVTHRKPIQSKF